jgi:phenylacetate-CoA ligase
MKYRVAIIGEFPPPWGGMAVQAQHLSDYLKKDGHQIFNIGWNYCFPGHFRWINNQKILRGCIRFMIFKARILSKILKVDVLYIFSNSYLNFYLFTIPAVILGKIFNKRIIISYRGGAAEEFFGKRIHGLPRKFLEEADYITTPSGFLRDLFQKYGYTAVVIPSLIKFDSFVYKQRQGIAPNFLVTRHLEPEYNVQMVIRAFAIIREKYPDAKLKICGGGSEKIRLENLAGHMELGRSVEFLGSVPNDKVAALYATSDILLNGSNIDNLPVSILEAFACGLPVVSTRAGGIPYVVEDGVTGLLVGLNDFEAMAKNAIRLLEEQGLGRRLAENARKSLEKYSWEYVKTRLLPLLKEPQRLPLNAIIYQKAFFPVLDILRRRNNLQKLRFMRRSQYWPKETMEDWQLKRLNQLLTTAKEQSPFYRERLKGLKLPLASLAELQDIPVLTKKDIRHNLENIQCQGVADNLFIPGKTGGSTGEPMHYYYDKRGRDWNRGSVYRSQEWAGTFLGEKSVQMTGSHYDFTEFQKLKWKIIFWLQRYKSLPVSILTGKLLEQYYAEIIRYKPTSIWGYSSGIYQFARFIAEKHPQADFGFLKAIITSSETLFEPQREKINQVFGAGKVYDHYGSREMYLASECSQHRGYHIHSEVVIVEVVDQEGKAKQPGEMGRILITDLSNRVFPFIRYEIGDVGIMAEAQNCACGITLPKLAKVEGRIADVVALPDRILTPPNFTILLSDYKGIEEYQIVQKTKTDVVLKIVKNGDFKPEFEAYIKKGLRDLLGPGVGLELEYVQAIATPPSGKRRYVISEISQNEL